MDNYENAYNAKKEIEEALMGKFKNIRLRIYFHYKAH